MDKKKIIGIILIMMSFFLFGIVANDIIRDKQETHNQPILIDSSERISITNPSFSFKPNEIPNSEEEIINNCKNLGIEKTSQCLVENVATFYKYQITDDKINLSFEQLKELGGDCRDYAFLYERLAKEIGFNSTTNTYQSVEGVHNAHRWAEIWDGNIYCKINTLEVECYKIKW